MAYQPKKHHKLFATAATAAMVATVVAPAAHAAELKFTDVEGQYVEAVQWLVDEEITAGMTDTTFGTHAPITRGQAAIFISNALGLDTENAPDAGFKDANDRDDRTRGAINAIVEKGILLGYQDGKTFGTDDKITRQAVAVAIARAYDLDKEDVNGVELPFTDVYEDSQYEQPIKAFIKYGITQGKTDTTFGSYDDVTRGVFAVFLQKAHLAKEAIDNVAPEVVEVSSAKAINTTTFVVTAAKQAEASVASVDVTGKVSFDVTLNGEAWEVVSVIDNEDDTYTVEVADLDGEEGTLSINGKEFDIDYSETALSNAIQAVKDASAEEIVAALQSPVLNLEDAKTDYAVAYHKAVNEEKVFVNTRAQLQTNLINYVNGEFAEAVNEALAETTKAIKAYDAAFSATAQEKAFVELQAALDTLDELGLDEFDVKFATTTEGSEGLLGDKIESKVIATLYAEQLLAIDGELTLTDVQDVVNLVNDLDELRQAIDTAQAADNGSYDSLVDILDAYEAATTFVDAKVVNGDAKTSFGKTLDAVAENSANRIETLIGTFSTTASNLDDSSTVDEFKAVVEDYYEAKGLSDRLSTEIVSEVELDETLNTVLFTILDAVNDELAATIATSDASLAEIAEGGSTSEAALNSVVKIEAVEAYAKNASEIVALLDSNATAVDATTETEYSVAQFVSVLNHIENDIKIASKELFEKVNAAKTEAELATALTGIGSPNGTDEIAVRELFIEANGDKVYTSISEVKEDLADIVIISAINVANETNRSALPAAVKAFVNEFGNDAYINLRTDNREEVFGFFHVETMDSTLTTEAEVDAALTTAIGQYNDFLSGVNNATDVTTTRAALQTWVDSAIDAYGDAETAYAKVAELNKIADVNGKVTIEAATDIYTALSDEREELESDAVKYETLTQLLNVVAGTHTFDGTEVVVTP